VSRRRFTHETCAVARALEVLGDWWTLLLVREAFFGTRRFADFAANLGISRNVLSRRLEHLVAGGVLERVDAGQLGTRYEYVLTPRGKDLVAVLPALRQWGDRWIFGAGEDGQPIAGADPELRPGPGASRTTLRRFNPSNKSG
jgi:DNA-binding HxlR family transcriptional regulator